MLGIRIERIKWNDSHLIIISIKRRELATLVDFEQKYYYIFIGKKPVCRCYR